MIVSLMCQMLYGFPCEVIDMDDTIKKQIKPIKQFSNVLSHHESPKQLQCVLALIQVSGIVLEGWTAFFLNIFTRLVLYTWWCCLNCQSTIFNRCSTGIWSGECETHSIWFTSLSSSSISSVSPHALWTGCHPGQDVIFSG